LPALRRHYGRRLDFTRCEFFTSSIKAVNEVSIAFAWRAPADGGLSGILG
jgi:hypothetical protein